MSRNCEMSAAPRRCPVRATCLRGLMRKRRTPRQSAWDHPSAYSRGKRIIMSARSAYAFFAAYCRPVERSRGVGGRVPLPTLLRGAACESPPSSSSSSFENLLSTQHLHKVSARRGAGRGAQLRAAV
jgi:hypothetical protein